MSLIDEVRASRQMMTPTTARRIREEAGVSLRRMAREVGVEHTTLRRWEAGECQPRGESARRYQALLHELQTVLAS